MFCLLLSVPSALPLAPSDAMTDDDTRLHRRPWMHAGRRLDVSDVEALLERRRYPSIPSVGHWPWFWV